MSGKDSVKFYPVGETVIIEMEGGLIECEVLNHLKDDQLYVEDKESKFRFLVSPSKVKKQKIFYEEAEGRALREGRQRREDTGRRRV